MSEGMLVEAEIWTVARTDKGNAVLVRPVGSEVAVPIFIGHLEAQSILIGLGNVPMHRPLTHDLLLSILDQMKIKLDRVEITDLKDNTYYARIILKNGEGQIIIDSRPSDALGIASRAHCPVYIAEFIVDEAGISTSLITEESTEESTVPNPEELEKKRLEKELEKAIEAENYEEAAKLRDRLKEL